jgi:hypothetical protein
MDTPTLPGAMLKILFRNGLRTRDLKWEPLKNMTKSGNTYSMELDFAVHPHPPPTKSSRSIRFHTMFSARNASTPKKAENKALHGWWKYWRQQGKQFLQGGASKIKDHDLQKIFDLYSAGIFSGISFEMQNGLPFRMHQLSITYGVSNSLPTLPTLGLPDSFQLPTAKDPKNYGLKEDGVPDSILLASGMNFPNDDMEKVTIVILSIVISCPLHLIRMSQHQSNI